MAEVLKVYSVDENFRCDHLILKQPGAHLALSLGNMELCSPCSDMWHNGVQCVTYQGVPLKQTPAGWVRDGEFLDARVEELLDIFQQRKPGTYAIRHGHASHRGRFVKGLVTAKKKGRFNIEWTKNIMEAARVDADTPRELPR
jgi:hypothetical protein